MPLRPELAGVRAVFFDLDDTICGYWDAARSGLEMAVQAHIFDPGFQERFRSQWSVSFRYFVETLPRTHWYAKYLKQGETTRTELMRRTLEDIGVVDEGLAQSLSHTYHVERQAALTLFDDALRVLTEVSSTHKLALITNGPADIQREEIEKLGVGPFFPFAFIEGEMGFGKPDRRVFDLATETLRVEPSEAVMVGNSYRHDIRPAADYGMRSVWVRRTSDVPPTSTTGRPEERPEGAPEPDLVVGSLSAILA